MSEPYLNNGDPAFDKVTTRQDAAMGEVNLDAIERGLDGVTPGPWFNWRATSNCADICSGTPQKPVRVAQVINTIHDGLYEYQRKDVAHIASCDPDTVRALIRLARIGKAVVEGSEETVGRAVVALAKEDPIVAQMLGFKECCELVRSILSELAKDASPDPEGKEKDR
jgi:hypothetical protein